MKNLNLQKIAQENPKVDLALAAQFVGLLTAKQGARYGLGQPLGGMPERPKQEQVVVLNRSLAFAR